MLAEWVWDPPTMRLVCAAAAVGPAWRHAAWWTALWPAVTVDCGLLLWLLHRFGAGRVRWRTAVAAAVASVVGGERDPGVTGRPLALVRAGRPAVRGVADGP
ncbi:hypothetical protein [Streptomyces sp. NPDC054783]